MSSVIRPIVLCLFRRDQRILVNEARDTVRQLSYCRPLGGGIEFGESSADALVREIREELNAEVVNLRLLGTLENIFVNNGVPGHEIVLIYDGEFADASLYDQPWLPGVESNGVAFQAHWRSLEDFSAQLPLYPDGLAALLRSTSQT